MMQEQILPASNLVLKMVGVSDWKVLEKKGTSDDFS